MVGRRVRKDVLVGRVWDFVLPSGHVAALARFVIFSLGRGLERRK